MDGIGFIDHKVKSFVEQIHRHANEEGKQETQESQRSGDHGVDIRCRLVRSSDVNSATTQFFINLKDNAFLDHGGRDFGYAVFGRVTAGMDVVDAIAAVKTGRRGHHDDVPVEPVLIREARRQ